MAGIYSNLADIARHTGPGAREPYRALKILRDDTSETERMAELSPGAAWLALDALVDVKRPGDARFWRHFTSSRIVGWKTGTSYGLRDGWASGTTPSHTVAVWVGNASGEGRPGLTGSAAAAPILFDLINRLDPVPWFRTPFLHMKQVEVCKNGRLPRRRRLRHRASLGAEAQSLRESQHVQPPGASRPSRTSASDGCVRGTGTHEPPLMVRAAGAPRVLLPKTPRGVTGRFRGFAKTVASPPVSKARAVPSPFSIRTPEPSSYIPTDLARKRGETVFEAVHRRPDATLFWHLDDIYLGSTKTFHQQGLDMTPGRHIVTVVDETGKQTVAPLPSPGPRTLAAA